MMKYLQDIEADINWLAKLIEKRIRDTDFDFESLKPDAFQHESVYSSFIDENKITSAERLLILLAFVPHIYPVFLYEKFNRSYLKTYHFCSYLIECLKYHSAIIKSPSSDSFLPTGQTFLYLVGGQNLEKRILYTKYIFEKRFYTISNNVIYPMRNNDFDPLLGNIISLSHNYVLSFLTNDIELIKSSHNERI